jgi:hypothetical protein
VSESEFALRKANLARYMGGDQNTHGALVRALSRLPDDALDLAIEKCVFFSCGGGVNAQCLPTRLIGEADWLVLIYDLAPDIETVIAHEVAYAYLGHSIGDPMSDEETETRARELTRTWGFSGKGADS